MKNEISRSLFEQHGITYLEVNGVFIPNIELPEQKKSVGLDCNMKFG